MSKILVAQLIKHEPENRIKWTFEELEKNNYIVEEDETGWKIYKDMEK